MCDALVELQLGEHAAAFRRCSMDGSMLGDLGALWDELGVALTPPPPYFLTRAPPGTACRLGRTRLGTGAEPGPGWSTG